jgi:hypothetical protein
VKCQINHPTEIMDLGLHAHKRRGILSGRCAVMQYDDVPLIGHVRTPWLEMIATKVRLLKESVQARFGAWPGPLGSMTEPAFDPILTLSRS